MSGHVHYDLDAFERQFRADAAAAPAPTNEFERLQRLGDDVSMHFGKFLMQTDNEGVDARMQVQAASAIIASLIENLVNGLDGDRREITTVVLNEVAQFALRGGDVIALTDGPVVQSGRA